MLQKWWGGDQLGVVVCDCMDSGKCGSNVLKFAAINCENIHAVGGLMPHACVKYARNAVPDKMTGSCDQASHLCQQCLSFYH